MANSYKPGKWSGTIQANIVGDANKTTPTLGDDFDVELKNLKKAQKTINTAIDNIKKQTKALRDHEDTGKMATDYLKTTEKRLDKMKSALTSEVNKLNNVVTKAQKDEWNRIRKILEEWYAAQQQGN